MCYIFDSTSDIENLLEQYELEMYAPAMVIQRAMRKHHTRPRLIDPMFGDTRDMEKLLEAYDRQNTPLPEVKTLITHHFPSTIIWRKRKPIKDTPQRLMTQTVITDHFKKPKKPESMIPKHIQNYLDAMPQAIYMSIMKIAQRDLRDDIQMFGGCADDHHPKTVTIEGRNKRIYDGDPAWTTCYSYVVVPVKICPCELLKRSTAKIIGFEPTRGNDCNKYVFWAICISSKDLAKKHGAHFAQSLWIDGESKPVSYWYADVRNPRIRDLVKAFGMGVKPGEDWNFERRKFRR